MLQDWIIAVIPNKPEWLAQFKEPMNAATAMPYAINL
jgi:hypothetical protein